MEDAQSATAHQTEESIFEEKDLALDHYDKHVRQARNAIFIVAAVQFILVLYTAFRVSDQEGRIGLAVMGVITLVFFFLGLWTKKNPYAAILSALILYGLLLLLGAINSPASIIQGILVKIFIIGYLVKGFRSAHEARRWKALLGNKG